MSRFLYRLGRSSARNRRWVVVAWILVIVGLFAGGKIAGGEMKDEFSLPGVEAQQATDLLKTSFPAFAGASAQVVFHSPEGTCPIPRTPRPRQRARRARRPRPRRRATAVGDGDPIRR